jgi:hypothetical protein
VWGLVSCGCRHRVGWVDTPPGYFTQSPQLVDVVRRFKPERMPQSLFQEGGVAGGCVVRLCTNILHGLLIQA